MLGFARLCQHGWLLREAVLLVGEKTHWGRVWVWVTSKSLAQLQRVGPALNPQKEQYASGIVRMVRGYASTGTGRSFYNPQRELRACAYPPPIKK